MRILRSAGKLEELIHWNILRLCETRCKNCSELTLDDRHKIYFSGEEDRTSLELNF